MDAKSNHKTWTLPLVVVNAAMSLLLGRNWLGILDEAWTLALCVNAVKDALFLEGITEECDDLFKEELERSKNAEVNLQL